MAKFEPYAAFPLDWPKGKRRNTRGTRLPGPVRLELRAAFEAVFAQLRLLGNDIRTDWGFVTSDCMWRANPLHPLVEAEDPGVAVFWFDRTRLRYCLAVDRHHRLVHNLQCAANILSLLAKIRAVDESAYELAIRGFESVPGGSIGG